ncbi:MAG: hypothetical protein COU25_01165 [Candidatus Levybacteria bacterium CG10_big_fil_rev_8_21_14_0_10_35_13]|nr:MAG: hypothetical protein COU25_01165 [Candidatus Levybacteria bacterium CG10_big_fil_rev_8_21_14_0_10_35_13]
MDKIIFKYRFLLLGLILILGLLLRSHNIYTWPRLGATFDEYAWVWLGMSLIQTGIPQSWSPQPQYEDKKQITYQKAHFVLVKPYLEHPPLFGLVAGSFAMINGVDSMFKVNIDKIRGLALLLGVLSIFILYVFAAEVYGYKIGLISSFLYSIIPTTVIGSRLVQNENFFIPLFLLSLFLIVKFVKTKKPWFRNSAAIICGLLILAKIPWIAASLAVVLILFYLRKYKDALIFLAIVIFISSLYIVYGIYFDSKLFFELFSFQLQRYDLTFNSFFALFTSPYLIDRFLIDGWIYFGWLAIFLLAVRNFKTNFMVLIPFIAYFIIFVFAIPNEAGHGWYRYPFYPFLIISIGLFLTEYFNKNYFLTFIFLIFTGLSMLELSWKQSFEFSFIVFRAFLVLFGISLAPFFLPKTKKIAYLSSYLSLCIILLLSVWSVFKYNEQ